MRTPTELLLAAEAERLRRPLLAAHRATASREDLEDLYSQSVLELLLRVRRDPSFNTPAHIANALRLRFASRISDHHRALAGRSGAAVAHARAKRLDDPHAPAVPAGDVTGEVLLREQARELLIALNDLPPQQRNALLAEAAGRDAPASWAEIKRCNRGRATLRSRLR